VAPAVVEMSVVAPAASKEANQAPTKR
jgi:hypothetical protein